jgi:hypothetical protein
MGRLPKVPDSALMAPMKIIQHADCFEVRSERGLIVRKFAFEEDDQEKSLPSRQSVCRQELYGRNGEAVDLSGYQPPPSSRPIPSRQSRNASKTRPGVQANIMPKNTACKVVMGFRSSTLLLLFKISAMDTVGCR